MVLYGKIHFRLALKVIQSLNLLQLEFKFRAEIIGGKSECSMATVGYQNCGRELEPLMQTMRFVYHKMAHQKYNATMVNWAI